MKKKKEKKDNSTVVRAERQYVEFNKTFDELCWYSKNLYNLANWYIRQAYLIGWKDVSQLDEKRKEIINKINKKIDVYNEITTRKKLPYIGNGKSVLVDYPFLDYTIRNLLDDEFPEGESNPYKQLPVALSQAILKNVVDEWNGYLASLSDYKKNPHKYKGKPKYPSYKDIKNGRNKLYFASNGFSYRDGKVYLCKNKLGIEYNSNVTDKKIQQVRVLPRKDHHIIETVYKYENNKEYVEKFLNNPKQRYISIDIGINNLCTIANNIGEKPIVINGKPIKSINKYYNKLKAKAMSYVGGKGYSNRTRRLDRKRNNKIDTIMHKISRYIVTYCEENDIDVIVIGKNKGWKQKVSMGKVNNQTFTQIPFAKLISKIKYKAEEKGIHVIEREESYTSKCDALALEPIKKHEKYLGKRRHRGLFISSIGRMINADVNGALNILRKEIGDEFVKDILKNKVDLTPKVVTIV